MNKQLSIAAALAAGALGMANTASANVILSGSFDVSENGCTQIALAFAGKDCSSAAGRYTNFGGAGVFFAGWTGPVGNSFGYYTAGSVALGHSPTPGDGKINPALTGDLTITGTGLGATIGGTITMGAATRAGAVGNGTYGVETWSSVVHTLATSVVSAATANGNGGFDYVIGADGLPGAICTVVNPADCFTSETGSQTTGADPTTWSYNGITNPALLGAAVGVERGATWGGNAGTTTTAVLNGYSSSCSVAADCATGTLIWGATGNLGNWDNLILSVKTDAAGNITSAEGWWTQEYLIAFGSPASYSGDNSFQAGHFTFSGAVIPVPAAVWLFGSALGLMGLARRRRVAA